MLDLDLQTFSDRLQQGSGHLGLMRIDGSFQATDSHWDALAQSLQEHTDYEQHEAVFFYRGPKTGQVHGVFLHRTLRGPGAGGVRRRRYGSLGEMCTDGLRLAIGMGFKNASAGLWWGGGKGVIGLAGEDVDRDELYSEFGHFLSSLNGCYVTAEDVGTKPEDMATIFKSTRFTTCIPHRLGGSGNPSPTTARGVFAGIQAIAKFWERDSLQGLSVAIQGLGEVGSRLAIYLHEAGANLKVYDPDQARMTAALALDSRHQASTSERIHCEEVDILAPCALGATLNPETIPELRCRAICGAANNQLAESARDSNLLHQHSILYVPDFVVNRMGIVGCADEQYGRLSPDPSIERHLGWEWENAIAPLVIRLLSDSSRRDVPPLVSAEEAALVAMNQDHPIWPKRAQQIAKATWEAMKAGHHSL